MAGVWSCLPPFCRSSRRFFVGPLSCLPRFLPAFQTKLCCNKRWFRRHLNHAHGVWAYRTVQVCFVAVFVTAITMRFTSHPKRHKHLHDFTDQWSAMVASYSSFGVPFSGILNHLSLPMVEYRIFSFLIRPLTGHRPAWLASLKESLLLVLCIVIGSLFPLFCSKRVLLQLRKGTMVVCFVHSFTPI